MFAGKKRKVPARHPKRVRVVLAYFDRSPRQAHRRGDFGI